ncbi:hypothetical protein [Lentzea flaviverrucosa]|uniref:DUF2690 domain-containing protein n=1 Tax=Lentzea flaviverrucosa TaxID=200379 RepID=A0A1H9XA48_9PSEU|nr:hypothetical protein [Lentzea flaviverrucosa]RDI21696.1 hypothetical protein DFR72_113243 [Lentzea flaviverrucosa]SES43088.1 hypothetical protein SAMN05216195_11437 [Lentzea flaviverrucosa]
MQKKIGAVVLAAAALAMTFTATAQAETNPKCPSGVTQIGSTKYLKSGGETVASVKQFKGCNKNWAYVYVWDSWRAKHKDFYLRAAIWTRTGSEAIDYNGGSRGQQEVWSNGANTLSQCTYAVGDVLWQSGTDLHGSTDERC